jgi:predicted RNase H-like HicB family nuclease
LFTFLISVKPEWRDTTERKKIVMDDRFDGFSVSLFLDDSGSWVAHLLEKPEVSAFSDTPENALSELADAWCGVKEVCKKRNIPMRQVANIILEHSMSGWTSHCTGHLLLKRRKRVSH